MITYSTETYRCTCGDIVSVELRAIWDTASPVKARFMHATGVTPCCRQAWTYLHCLGTNLGYENVLAFPRAA